MNILLYISVLLVNGLFMMLTTLLPILIYNLTGSSLYVGQVLTTFMVSLVINRIVCMIYKFETRKLLLFGSITFFIGFTLIYIVDSELWIYFLGAIFFGASIAILSPALLTILTNNSESNTKNISVYNSLVAISSAFSPGIAEMLMNKSLSLITLFWIVGSLILVGISLYSFKTIKSITDEKANKIENKDGLSKSSAVVLKTYKKTFIVLFLTSISYGAIISYLPVYYAQIGISIGVFYLLFWGSYVLAQGLGAKIIQRISNSIIVLICLLGLLFSQILINISPNIISEILSASVYGFSYGLMYYAFYQQMTVYKDEHTRSNGFAIIGLMSYIGVGVAPIFLYPFLSDLNTLFIYSSFYIVLAFIYFYICNRKKFNK